MAEYPDHYKETQDSPKAFEGQPMEGDLVRHNKWANFGGTVRRTYESRDEYGKPVLVVEMFTADEKIISAPIDQLVVIKKKNNTL